MTIDEKNQLATEYFKSPQGSAIIDVSLKLIKSSNEAIKTNGTKMNYYKFTKKVGDYSFVLQLRNSDGGYSWLEVYFEDQRFMYLNVRGSNRKSTHSDNDLQLKNEKDQMIGINCSEFELYMPLYQELKQLWDTYNSATEELPFTIGKKNKELLALPRQCYYGIDAGKLNYMDKTLAELYEYEDVLHYATFSRLEELVLEIDEMLTNEIDKSEEMEEIKAEVFDLALGEFKEILTHFLHLSEKEKEKQQDYIFEILEEITRTIREKIEEKLVNIFKNRVTVYRSKYKK